MTINEFVETKVKSGELKVFDIIGTISNITGSSRTQAQRLLEQGAIKLNGETIKERFQILLKDDILKVGKRCIRKLINFPTYTFKHE